MNKLFPQRFSTLKSYVLTFLVLSFLIRLTLYIWSFSDISFNFLHFIRTFFTGIFFDIGTISFFAVPFSLYLLLFPLKYQGSFLDRIIMYSAYFIGILIFVFTFFAEITFWEEFERRFNFIAVDYLVYTYEVVQNINESYPLPILLTLVVLATILLIWIPKKLHLFEKAFKNKDKFSTKWIPTLFWIVIAFLFGMFVQNKNAEWSTNRYENEISKSGIYAFFSAFKNNELNYNDFYKSQDIKTSFQTVHKLISTDKTVAVNDTISIKHTINSVGSELKPNVVLICIESLSAKYLGYFGNDENITPYLDKLAENSIMFDSVFATGTRTIRGMEAIMLSIPPTPGRSIVKRANNSGLFTIGEVFKQKGYSRTFFYGGDGYFDNMNAFFGGNGFDITDRGRGFLMENNFNVTRTNINDDEVTFENAWGVCDEDIYNKVIQQADASFKKGSPFFNFVMTTSNHRPYTYPENKIDIPSGTGRKGAIKYTDYAIEQFIKNASKKPWFKNTVFVIMADHCASSAGKSEVDIKNYHIPAMIYNLPNGMPQKIDKQCSQIDIFPTLFAYLNLNYTSNFFGRDINKFAKKDERAFVGNYQKLGLLKGNKALILGTVKTANLYNWNKKTNDMNLLPMEKDFLEETISYYQSADYLYQNSLLKLPITN